MWLKGAIAVFILLLLLGSASPALAQQAQPSGNITLRIYPDGWIDFSGDLATVKLLQPEFPSASTATPSTFTFHLAVTPAEASPQPSVTPSTSTPIPSPTPETAPITAKQYKVVFDGSVEVEEAPSELEDLKLKVESFEKGSREHSKVDTRVEANIPGEFRLTMNITGETSWATRESTVNFTVNFEVYYSEDFTEREARQLAFMIPMAGGMLQSMVQAATDGQVKIDRFALTRSTIEKDKAIFAIEGAASGNLAEGLATVLEKAARGEQIFPGVPSLEKPPEDEAMLVSASLIRELSTLRHAWVREGSFILTWNPAGAFTFKGEGLVEGDLNRQATEVIHTWLKHYPDMLTEESKQKYEECTVCQGLREAALNLDFNLERLNLTLEAAEEEAYLKFSGFKVKSECPKCLLDLLGKISVEKPYESLLLTVMAGSTREQMVQLSLPADVEPKPVSSIPPYKYTWKFSNLLEALNALTWEVKPNWTGIADFTYASSKQIEVFTSSPEIAELKVEESRVTVKVEGPEGSQGKLCLKLPRETVEGVILASVDGETIKPEVRLLDGSLAATVTYTHSMKTVKFWWAKPTIILSLSKSQAQPGEEILASGSLLAGETPLGNEPIQILVDGKPMATAVTDPNGAYATPISISVEGTHSITATYTYLDETYNSQPATVTITLPWHMNPITYMVIAGVAAAIAIVTLLHKKRRKK